MTPPADAADDEGSNFRNSPRRPRPTGRPSGKPAGKGAGTGRPSGKSAGRRGAAPPARAPSGFGPHGPPRAEGSNRDRVEPEPERRPRRPAPLRVVGTRTKPAEAKPGLRRVAGQNAPDARRRKRRATPDVESEIRRLGGRRSEYLLGQVTEAAEAFANDRDRAAARILRPVRDVLPDAASVRELLGLVEYRVGNYRAAAKELEAFVELTDSCEQHPVLMDCYRAQKRWKRVDELWGELGVSSPSAELVTEGRIVLAGSLADRGRLGEAIDLLRRKSKPVARPREHHLRLWYALADLEERAGNLSAARELFARVRRFAPDFADVSVRSAGLR